MFKLLKAESSSRAERDLARWQINCGERERIEAKKVCITYQESQGNPKDENERNALANRVNFPWS